MKLRIAAGVTVLLAMVVRAEAADVDLSMHVGNTYTDNALLTPIDEQSDNVGGAAVKFDYDGKSARTEATLRAAVTYLHYFRGTLDDETLRGFAGDVTVDVLPDRLRWVFQDNYGPVLEDPLSPDRPDNWTYDNYFTTGPDLQFGDEAGFHVIGAMRYSRADYENDLVPSGKLLQGRVGFYLPGTPTSERSLQVVAKRVEEEAQDNDLAAPTDGFDTQEAYFRIANTLARGLYFVEAGATSLHDAGESSTVPLVRLGLERNLSRTLSTTLSLGSQYSDNLGRFSRLQNESDEVSDPRTDVTSITDPLQEEFVNWLLEMNGHRTTAALNVSYNQIDYEHNTTAFDAQEYWDASLEFSRQLTPRWSLDVGASFNRREFGELNRTDDDFSSYLAASWQLQSDLAVQLTGRWQKRDSSDPTANYLVRSVQLEFIYRAISRRSAGSHMRRITH